ncbi:diaminopimelate epimerase [Thermodesulfobacteriota bacterium]
MPFNKYHALGNDYIVLTPDEFGEEELTADIIRLICHRNYGIGSDGILYGPFDDPECDFALRIYNPDGNEAEKSGNGLRIFSRYLWDQGAIDSRTVSIKTAGGPVKAQIRQQGKIITVDMGQVSFDSCKIPVTGAAREVINETIDLKGQILEYCAATIGNPHCVVLRPEVSADEARKWGPLIETDPRFPNRTNVQFVQILDRSNIRIEIWERGAGYTLASGSSSSAAAAVAYRLGLCDQKITVYMPGGKIEIEIGPDFAISITGAVTRVATGTIDPEMFEA